MWFVLILVVVFPCQAHLQQDLVSEKGVMERILALENKGMPNSFSSGLELNTKQFWFVTVKYAQVCKFMFTFKRLNYPMCSFDFCLPAKR